MISLRYHAISLAAVFLALAIGVVLGAGLFSDTLLAATRGWRAMRPTVLLDRLLRPGLQVAALAVDLADPCVHVCGSPQH